MEKNKYINKFGTLAEWINYINSETAKTPNIAYISNADIVKIITLLPESENIMFARCKKEYTYNDFNLNTINTTLHRISNTDFFYANLSDKTSDITSLQYAFNSSDGWAPIIELYKFVVPENITSAESLVRSNQDCYIEMLNLNDVNFSHCTSMYSMCNNMRTLEIIILNDNIDTSSVTDMRRMFYNCRALKSLDLSKFDTTNVTNMENMFYYCTSLETLDLSSFDTTNVTSINQMLYHLEALKKLYISADFFNSTTITSYGFDWITNWTDEETIAIFVEAITAHDGTGKQVWLHTNTKNAMTQAQKDAITGAGWTIK